MAYHLIGLVPDWTVGWAGHEAHMRAMRSASKILIRRTQGKKSLGKPRHRWENNTKMDLGKKGLSTWAEFIWLTFGYKSELL
jgi:hypothetical protein